ncbi:MAG: hypothetical protein K2M31_04970 [Muribaculaceae bacterium]|nr:hypothetical protein [Muribaculaceae bacterium]
MKTLQLTVFILLLGLLLSAVSCGNESAKYPGSNESSANNIKSEETESLLLTIDSLISRRSLIDRDHVKKIDRATARRRSAPADSIAYNLDSELYDLYNGFRQDSAFHVASDRLEIAMRLGDRDKIMESRVLKAQALMNMGENALAVNMLDSIDSGYASAQLRDQMNSIYFGAYSSLAKTIPSSDAAISYRRKADAYRDSIISSLPVNSVGHKYLNAQRLYDNGDLKAAMELLGQNSDSQEFTENAAFQCGYGMLYMEAGDRGKAIERLARASGLDLKDGKKEYVSLILLASLLYEEGDIERSFQYLKCALEDASFSRAGLRAQEIFDILPVIEGAYRTYQELEKERMQRNIKISIGITIFLLLAMAALWLQFRRISRMKRLLAHSNAELQRKTEWLTAMDNAKINLIESLLKLHSSNLSIQKKYRRDLLRLMKGHQYDRVTDRLTTDSIDNSEIKLFYETFDATFMSIFPDFIEELNQYLSHPYSELHPDSFTPEQRIMALMKFGYTSASDISTILQYSQQTVYNYSSAIRKMLNCSRDDFLEAIRLPTIGERKGAE